MTADPKTSPYNDPRNPEAIEPGFASEGVEEVGETVVLTDDSERIEALEAEIASIKDQLLRTLADTENMRRRAEREKEDGAKFAVSGFARDLLSVADNLRRALESLTADQVPNDAVQNMLTGVEATERELLAAFEKRGVRRIFPMGERFDPNFHQAMFEIPSATDAPGTILQVLQPGYVLHDRLLRPALVGVSKAAEGSQARVNTQA